VGVRVDPRASARRHSRVRRDPTRLRDELGWEPAIELERTLTDVLDYWRGV